MEDAAIARYVAEMKYQADPSLIDREKGAKLKKQRAEEYKKWLQDHPGKRNKGGDYYNAETKANYNSEYYQKNKDKILARQKERRTQELKARNL
jgi:hypothetical protein